VASRACARAANQRHRARSPACSAARCPAARLRSPAAHTADWFAEYRDYRAITERLRELAALAPDRVTLRAIGSSLDNRPLWALRIAGGAPGATPMLIRPTCDEGSPPCSRREPR